jgi:hypothetical protein
VPTQDTLQRFRRLVEQVVRPRRVIPLFATQLRVFIPEELLQEVLEYMHHGGFTQVVARDQGALRLVTAAGITRWLAAQLEAVDGRSTAPCVELGSAIVADVLRLEKPEALALLPAKATLEEAVDAFQRSIAGRHGRLFALVITQHGRGNEDPLGIITPADLLLEE